MPLANAEQLNVNPSKSINNIRTLLWNLVPCFRVKLYPTWLWVISEAFRNSTGQEGRGLWIDMGRETDTLVDARCSI